MRRVFRRFPFSTVIYKYVPLKNNQIKKYSHVPFSGQPSGLPPPASQGAAPGLLRRALVSTRQQHPPRTLWSSSTSRSQSYWRPDYLYTYKIYSLSPVINTHASLYNGYSKKFYITKKRKMKWL